MRLLKKVLPGYKTDLSVFSQPKLPFYIALIALILTLPTLFLGFQADDYIHRGLFPNDSDGASLSDFPLYREIDTSTGMYSWFDGNPERNQAAMEAGLPWWTDKNIKSTFLRPIAGLSLWIDYRFWPNTPVLMRLQNMLWYAAIVFALVVLFRRIMGNGMVAGLAALLYAISRTHTDALTMVAGRFTLQVTFFAILVLIIFDRVQKDRWQIGRLLGPLFLLVALLFGEYAIVITAYLFSYSLFLGPKSIKQKIVSLLPYAVISVIWLIIYKAIGYGSYSSSGYIDPIESPARFLIAFTSRFPAMLTSQLYATLPLGFGLNSLGSTSVDSLVSLVLLVIAVIVLIPFLKSNAITRFWALGFTLAVIPMCVSLPAERYLMVAGIGAYALLAQIFKTLFKKTDRIQMSFIKKAYFIPTAVVLAFLHIGLSPLLLLTTPSYLKGFYEQNIVKPAISIPTDDQYPQQNVILINPPAAMFVPYMSAVRVNRGLSLPARTWVLSSGSGEMLINRVDEYTIEIEIEGGFMATDFDQLYRDPLQRPLKKGEIVELTGMTVTVLSLNEAGRPQIVSFGFEKPLADQSLKFLAWDNFRIYDFEMPGIGENKTLAKQNLTPKKS